MKNRIRQSPLSNRFMSGVLQVLVATVILAESPRAGEAGLSGPLEALIGHERFSHAHWGILVQDMETGEELESRNAEKFFIPASVTKLFSTAAAMDALGAGHRFETKVFASAMPGADGVLEGDLVLLASGDLTMGGRTLDDDTLAFRDSDHTYAGFSSASELVDVDPLGGLRELAARLAGNGLSHVKGEVAIDARMFKPETSSGSGPEQVTAFMINDNVIDVLVTPGAEPGMAAVVTSRPVTARYAVDALVETVAAEQETEVRARRLPGRGIEVRGRIAAGRKPLVRIVELEDPVDDGRALFIECLREAGVRVDASPLVENPHRVLASTPESYAGWNELARLVSPPFSENAKVILKVSHNLHASALPMLIAARHGESGLAAGLSRIGGFLDAAGVRKLGISFGGGAGGARADHVTPRATVRLLDFMAGTAHAGAYRAALPVLGVDGTLRDVVSADSPARGRVQAKTGTLVWDNGTSGGFLLTSKALAGYLTAASGRELAFAFFVNHVPVDRTEDIKPVAEMLGALCEQVFRSY